MTNKRITCAWQSRVSSSVNVNTLRKIFVHSIFYNAVSAISFTALRPVSSRLNLSFKSEPTLKF